MMIVDSHCHLDFPNFEGALGEVLAHASAEGVGHFLTISTRLSRFDAIREIAESDPRISCSVGVHPHQSAEEAVYEPEPIVAQCAHPKAVAIGETGLDYFYHSSPRDLQERSFLAHIEAARRTGLPLIIHTRDADERTAEVLTSEYRNGAFTGLLHCFTGGEALARAALDIGFCVSFSGIVTFKKSEELRRIACLIPEDRILVETDAPFLAPEPYRGKRNEPAYVVHTLRALAEARGVSAETFADQTTATFFRLFSKAERAA